jgi:hypothetical protein
VARIAIIGGGWYGCHIACEMIDVGHDVTLFERHPRLFHEASGNNQYRLHHGYHYPRNYYTRRQSLEGFARFMETYPELTRPVDQNIYAVPRQDSLLDFRTYCTIMRESGLHVKEIASPEWLFNTEGRIQTDERVVLTSKAREHFTKLLERVQYECPSVIREENGNAWVNGSRYDFVVDATWGHLSSIPVEVTHQPTLMLYYWANHPFPAVTLVDGPLCSIYPTEDPTVYTLSSVKHTPLPRDMNVTNDRESLLIQARKGEMESQISRYIPSFRDIFRYIGPQFSCKTKPVGLSDDRACRVFKNGRVISVLSGKIDGIFYAADKVKDMVLE